MSAHTSRHLIPVASDPHEMPAIESADGGWVSVVESPRGGIRLTVDNGATSTSDLSPTAARHLMEQIGWLLAHQHGTADSTSAVECAEAQA